jgi:hypothetical protein
LRQSGAELIAQDAGADLFDLAFAQFAELEWSEGDPDQPVDGQAQMLEDALDLAVLAFAQSHRQPAIGALLAVERGFDPGIANPLDGDAFGKAVEDCLIGFAIGAHAIAPEPAGGRQFQNAGEASIIGQQQQAFGVNVEPADAQKPWCLRRMQMQKIEDGGAAFRVLMRGDEAARLVEEKKPCALPLGQGLAIDADFIGGTDRHRRARQCFAIDGDAALRDPVLGIAARAKPGAGHDLGNAIGRRWCSVRSRGAAVSGDGFWPMLRLAGAG